MKFYLLKDLEKDVRELVCSYFPDVEEKSLIACETGFLNDPLPRWKILKRAYFVVENLADYGLDLVRVSDYAFLPLDKNDIDMRSIPEGAVPVPPDCLNDFREISQLRILKSCGHYDIVNLPVGISSQKELHDFAVREFARRPLCLFCWNERKEEERQKASEYSKFKKFPKLRGTKKQIAWAESIRAERLADLESPKDQALYCKLVKITASRFWIDTRNIPDWQIEQFIPAE